MPLAQPLSYTGGNNRVDNYGSAGYDLAGNVTYDLTNHYAYDAEGTPVRCLQSRPGLDAIHLRCGRATGGQRNDQLAELHAQQQRL